MVELNKYTGDPTASATQISTGLLAMFVGGTAFTGSLIAYFKLSGSLKDSAIKIPGSTYVNIFLLLVMVAGIIFFTVTGTGGYMTVLVLLAISLIYGFTFVIPIGGGDMPVVISLLNAFTGIAAALAGLVYANKVMLFGGILVGASGTILTMLMCEAMNRSLFNVIIGGFGGSAAGGGGSDGDQTVKEMSLPDVAILLNYASSVVVVPGYGMAVAQAQNVCHDLEQELAKNGVEVTYAVHPVAGRMPGHMNVLLAEADVPYERLLDLEAANEALAKADVSIIVGANDVVNPAALDEPGSPVYGMPILRVFDSKRCLVMKRSMNPGYAGIQNKLFFHEKTYMLFGDAKDTLQKMLSEVKKLN
jgi:NAD(P) transhydrogenase subunit beta